MSSVALPYDLAEYGAALSHHGDAAVIDGWTTPVLQCRIPDSIHHDAIGPWPYATLPADVSSIRRLHAGLAARHLVSFSACARPDQDLDHATWQLAGFEVVLLKPHYVHRPHLPQPAFSAKTRANLGKARRAWRTNVQPATTDFLHLFAQWHDALNQRKDMSRFTHLPIDHFQSLAALDECRAIVASDSEGPGAAMLVMLAGDEIHCHALAGAPRAYIHRGFYAVYDALLAEWGSSHTLYLGGAPDGGDGVGIKQFKQRFANATAPVHMVRCVLDPTAADQLARTRGNPNWFPSYRSRHG